MKLNVYGKKIEVSRENDSWIVYELGEGKKSLWNNMYIPGEYTESEVITFLEDLFRERATPERPNIQIIE